MNSKSAFVLFLPVSLQKVKPAVSRAWHHSIERIASTRARPLVMNPVVVAIANQMDNFSLYIERKLKQIRHKQYQGELKYLEQKVEDMKRKIEESEAEASGKKC